MGKKPIILYEVCHEPYHIMMGELPYQFLLFNRTGAPKWSNKFGPLPKNHRVINLITPDIIPDIIISQNRRTNLGFYKELAHKYNSAMINIEFTLPIKNEAERFYGVAENCVYFSEQHANAWWGENYQVIKPIAQKEYACNQPIYLNNSIEFLSFLDVINNMAAKKCVISPPIYEINNLIQNFYSGILFDPKNQTALRDILNKLKINPDLVQNIGENGQKVVNEQFNRDQFVTSWIKLINRTLK